VLIESLRTGALASKDSTLMGREMDVRFSFVPMGAGRGNRMLVAVLCDDFESMQ